MREQRNDPKRLSDILQAIDTIFQYVEGRDKDAFLADIWRTNALRVMPASWTSMAMAVWLYLIFLFVQYDNGIRTASILLVTLQAQ